jgi:hypothetical protein
MRTSPTGKRQLRRSPGLRRHRLSGRWYRRGSCSHHRLHRGDPYRLSGVVGGPGLEAGDLGDGGCRVADPGPRRLHDLLAFWRNLSDRAKQLTKPAALRDSGIVTQYESSQKRWLSCWRASDQPLQPLAGPDVTAVYYIVGYCFVSPGFSSSRGGNAVILRSRPKSSG